MGSVSQEQEPGRFCAGAQGNSSHGGLPQRHSRHCLCRQSSPSPQAPTQQPGAGARAGRPREWDGKEAQHGCVRPWSCLTATRERNANQAQSHTAWAHNCLPTFLLIAGRALLPGALELPALPEQPSTSPRTANWSPGQDDAIERTHPPLPLTTVPPRSSASSSTPLCSASLPTCLAQLPSLFFSSSFPADALPAGYPETHCASPGHRWPGPAPAAQELLPT